MMVNNIETSLKLCFKWFELLSSCSGFSFGADAVSSFAFLASSRKLVGCGHLTSFLSCSNHLSFSCQHTLTSNQQTLKFATSNRRAYLLLLLSVAWNHLKGRALITHLVANLLLVVLCSHYRPPIQSSLQHFFATQTPHPFAANCRAVCQKATLVHLLCCQSMPLLLLLTKETWRR